MSWLFTCIYFPLHDATEQERIDIGKEQKAVLNTNTF